jgi:hypothetical protein
MRVTHHLWKVSNGWLLVPEGFPNSITPNEAPQAAVFKSLEEFAKYKPKRVRKPRKHKTTPTTEET